MSLPQWMISLSAFIIDFEFEVWQAVSTILPRNYHQFMRSCFFAENALSLSQPASFLDFLLNLYYTCYFQRWNHFLNFIDLTSWNFSGVPNFYSQFILSLSTLTLGKVPVLFRSFFYPFQMKTIFLKKLSHVFPHLLLPQHTFNPSQGWCYVNSSNAQCPYWKIIQASLKIIMGNVYCQKKNAWVSSCFYISATKHTYVLCPLFHGLFETLLCN